MQVKIIGSGTVGNALAKNMGLKALGPGKGRVEGDVIIICVPTPTIEGQQDLSAVEQALSRVKRASLVILRSTVLPGTTDALQQDCQFPIMFVPEFGNEDTMTEDLKNPPFYVFGLTMRSKDLTGLAYKVLPEGDNYLPIRAISAEFTKYFINLWGATQVTLANTYFDWVMAQTKDESIYEEAIFAAKNFQNLPQWGWKTSDKGGRGAGGKCLPKDLKASLTQNDSELLKVVNKLNDEYLRGSNKE